MSNDADISVLRRMASPRPQAVGLSAMTLAKALRYALARAGDEDLDTIIAMRDLVEDKVAPDDLAESIADPSMILRLEHGDGAEGLAIACPQLVAAVIEAKTIGHVLQAAAADRRPTQTDTVLVGPFLDQMLTNFGLLVEGCDVPPPVDGYVCREALADGRAGAMVLADAAHLRLSVELDLDRGAKSAKLTLIFPLERGQEVQPADQKDWHATLERSVLGSTARLEAVLCRIKLSLAEVTGLAVGQDLVLKDATVDGLELIGADRAPLLHARLGRSGPVRAVRIQIGEDAKPTPGAGMSALDTPAMAAPAAAAPEPVADLATLDSATEAGVPDLPPMGGGDMSGDLPDLPPMGGGDMSGDLPDLAPMGGGDMSGDLPDLPPMGGGDMSGDLPDLPPMGGGGAFEGELPEL